ncbi:hypothetical protein D9619_010654 [Psilocybe cf. subviscida]|uniref:Orc1-like AAA ATPase domain-containing protein n=1 Tax=Psilocybe cf. subviscida TaxID=2480587 RepID=A0A8H5F014_9AGAR|nr:hypothetical protein D9619_010654 [Psilocybe cf. subviscida]
MVLKSAPFTVTGTDTAICHRRLPSSPPLFEVAVTSPALPLRPPNLSVSRSISKEDHKTTTFVVNNTVGRLSLDVLYKRVAPNAILNAGGRADQVRCFPGTREEVINRIENWADTQDGLTAPMFWLSGPAGAGKSAIVQTIAERYSSRNHISPLVATLVHQIILLYPSLRDLVATVLSTNPWIFDSVLEIIFWLSSPNASGRWPK